MPSAFAATGVTVASSPGLQEAGPVSSEHGFPTWYLDKTGTRIEPCLEGDNPLCGFLPGDIPDPTQPVAFPANFPAEFFYFLAGAEIVLPTGGRAVYTTGLEAAFLNDVQPGEQVVFSRIRVVVRGATPNSTVTFTHPYGALTIDTDGAGDGRLVRDVAPSVGNFTLALRGDVGPFLKAANAPAGYLGNPAEPSTVTGGPNGNVFSMTQPGPNGDETFSTDQFTVQGRIATNTGVTGDAAVAGGDFVDVFASTTGAALEVVGQEGIFPTTIMSGQDGRFYARVPVTGAVTEVVVRNNGDNPASTARIPVQGVSVQQATYDGAILTVAASSTAPAAYPLTVKAGATTIGILPDALPATYPMLAPPATITVSSGTAAGVTAPVVITGGPASPAGTTAPPVGPNVPPVCDPSPCGPGGVPADAAPTARLASATLSAPVNLPIAIDGSTSTNATAFSTTTTDPRVTITNETTNRPTVTVNPFAAVNDAAPRPAFSTAPVTVTFTASNGAATSSATVTLTPVSDAVTITNARSRAGSDLRVAGTSTLNGQASVTPATQIVVYARTSATAAWVKIGTSPVDAAGAWDVRPRPAPNVTYTQYQVQTSRGSTVIGNLTG
ncbi:hypothetical protein [Pseudonocardia aurantiaca]|uniref:Uncharacterized protein n=1 Tax=Pseudonocardia aurantiaca TaxID=75290 RepID=A0ABW4FRL4_9PSEU